MIFAFSVQDFVDKIGAYVGFAAAIGLALLALLLFAQARELKRLREWGAHAHDRIGELERRLAAALELARRASTSQRTMAPGAVAQRPAAARPAPAAAAGRAAPAVARTSSPTRLPLLPAAPARVAGAALGSATVLLPLPKQPPGAVPAPAPAAAPAPGAVPAPATPPASAPAAIPAVAAAASAASAAASPAAPAPATAAGQAPAQPAAPAPVPAAPAPAPPAATNGHSDTFPPVPPVRRATPRPGARPAPGRRVPPRGPGRPAAGARPAAAAPLRARSAPTASPRGAGGGRAEAPAHGRRRLALLLGGLGLVAVAAIAVLALSSGDDSPSTSAVSGTAPPAGRTTPAARRTTPVAAPAHDRVTVAVLNGTTTAGLASTVAATLTADGFVQGPVTNASDQARSVTVVAYFGGHEAEAQEVAKTLGVPADAVQPIDADTEAACAQGGTCAATVVVTVGADRQ